MWKLGKWPQKSKAEAALQEQAAAAALHEQAAETAIHEQVEPQEQAVEAFEVEIEIERGVTDQIVDADKASAQSAIEEIESEERIVEEASKPATIKDVMDFMKKCEEDRKLRIQNLRNTCLPD